MQSHTDVIEAFGGRRALAEAVGVRPELAIHWHRRGIPAKYWPRVEEAAQSRGIPVTARDLMRLAGDGKQEDAA